MATMYCALCKRPVDARRQIGAGTVILAVISAGMSLIAIPFYAKRCAICKSKAVSPELPDGAGGAGATVALTRLADVEQRLRFTEQELEATSVELETVRTERDFYRQLLGDPLSPRKGPQGIE